MSRIRALVALATIIVLLPAAAVRAQQGGDQQVAPAPVPAPGQHQHDTGTVSARVSRSF